MLKLIKTDSGNADFGGLVEALDRELAVLDGEDHAYYAQFNKTGTLGWVVVAYWDGGSTGGVEAVGCGAIRVWEGSFCEVKRMYVAPEFRKRGIAGAVLRELERWAAELGFAGLVLETGAVQPEAIGLYRKNGYRIIENYGQYAGMETSVCMRKDLSLT